MSELTRDQKRAQHAYACVGHIAESKEARLQADYKVLINDLGAHVLRSGLAAAMAFLEREGDRGGATKQLLDDLAAAAIPGLGGAGKMGVDLPAQARSLPLEQYMLATRELLAVAQWLKRAAQALLKDKG